MYRVTGLRDLPEDAFLQLRLASGKGGSAGDINANSDQAQKEQDNEKAEHPSGHFGITY